MDLGLLFFAPYRRIERTGSGTPFDFATTSRNGMFYVPEGGYARRINDRWSWGVTVYGNGGLNTEYPGNTGIPSTNNNPARCGNRPGNFFGGCGNLGFDLMQLIVAPTLSYALTPEHSFGISPLIGYQQFRASGFQGFDAASESPNEVSDKGYDHAFGGGARVGWFGRVRPWLDLGAAYSTRVYMQRFDRYRGLLADHGGFDIPAIASVGAALKGYDLTLAFDLQEIMFGQIRSLRNGVLNTLQDPQGRPLGSKDGSGFNWRNQTVYRTSLAWHATPVLDLRIGAAYGHVAQADHSANTASFAMLAPNPALNLTAGFSYAWSRQTELHFAYGRYMLSDYAGPSALFPGARESLKVHVDTFYLAWSRTW